MGTVLEVQPAAENVTLPAIFLTVTVNVAADVPLTVREIGDT